MRGRNQAAERTKGDEHGYARRPFLMEQDLYGLRDGFGFVWAAGQARPVPIYAPPYFHVDAWRRRARANPYVRQGGNR